MNISKQSVKLFQFLDNTQVLSAYITQGMSENKVKICKGFPLLEQMIFLLYFPVLEFPFDSNDLRAEFL